MKSNNYFKMNKTWINQNNQPTIHTFKYCDMDPSSQTRVSDKTSNTKTTNAGATQKPDLDPNARPQNPYKTSVKDKEKKIENNQFWSTTTQYS